LRSKGLPSLNGYGVGDLLINIGVYVPENLSKDQKEVLMGMENSPNFQPSKSVKDRIFNRFRNYFD